MWINYNLSNGEKVFQALYFMRNRELITLNKGETQFTHEKYYEYILENYELAFDI